LPPPCCTTTPSISATAAGCLLLPYGQQLPRIAAITSSQSVAASTAGLTVAAVGADNGLWVKNFDASWSGWRRAGGLITADPALAATPGGSVLAVIRGSDNADWVNVANATATTWTGWRSIGGRLTSAPTVTVDSTAAHVFAYGTDGQIWENVATNASTANGWTGWRVMP
jgi:hypothetical protein